MSAATVPQLLEWAAATSHCELQELCLTCLCAVVRHLAGEPCALPAAFADASMIASACDKSLLARLLGMVLSATAGQRLVAALPAPAVAAAALERSANCCSFEWAVERFSEQPSGVGQVIYSPWCQAAGQQWRLQIYAGGYEASTAGHLSGECRQARHAWG